VKLAYRHDGEKGERAMEIDRWIGGFKVRSFPWIDGKRLYINVQYFAPGQSISQPPLWDKTVYLADNAEGQRIMRDYLHSLVEHISRMQIKEGSTVVLTA
jgi:hypothetical protein